MSKKSFYVTTPLYYVNAKPHVGTLYSTLLADVAARWHRFCGDDVFFLTGTDEHGQKIAQQAAQADMQPQAFVDSIVPTFEQAWKQYNISYDHFIRTTHSEHKQTVVKWIEQLLEKGDIYKDRYEGLYCVPCETFVTAEQAQENEQGQACPSCERGLQKFLKKTIFFAYQLIKTSFFHFMKKTPTLLCQKSVVMKLSRL